MVVGITLPNLNMGRTEPGRALACRTRHLYSGMGVNGPGSLLAGHGVDETASLLRWWEGPQPFRGVSAT